MHAIVYIEEFLIRIYIRSCSSIYRDGGFLHGL